MLLDSDYCTKQQSVSQQVGQAPKRETTQAARFADMVYLTEDMLFNIPTLLSAQQNAGGPSAKAAGNN